MPEFPRYQSKGQLTTQTPSASAPTDNTGSVIAEAGSQIGGDIQKSTLTISDAYDSMQKTQAELNFKKAVAEEQNKFLQIPNPTADDLDKTRTAIRKAKEANLRGFSNKTTQYETDAKFELEATSAGYQLENYYHKKNLELDLFNTQELIDIELDSQSPNALANIKKITDEKIPIYGAEAASKLYKDNVRTYGEYAVANDTADEESKSEVLAELKKGDKGRFKDIPPDERLSLIKASQQRIYNNNQTYKRDIADSQNERGNALIDKISDRVATIKDIEAEEAIPESAGGIKRSQLKIYKDAIISGTQGDLNRMLREKTSDGDPTKRAAGVKKYLTLIDDFIDDKIDQAKAKEVLADAYKDGILSEPELKLLNNLKQNLKDIEFNRSTSVVASTIRGVKDFLQIQSNSSDEDIARNIKMLVGDLAEGKDPGESARRILSKEIANRIPDISSFPETGKIMRDANGNLARVFPDGTYEEVTAEKSAQ